MRDDDWHGEDGRPLKRDAQLSELVNVMEAHTYQPGAAVYVKGGAHRLFTHLFAQLKAFSDANKTRAAYGQLFRGEI